MDIENQELFQFLKQRQPLDSLEHGALLQWHQAAELLYWRAGETILKQGEHNDAVYLLRSGAVEALDEKDHLINTIDEQQGWFGYRSVIRGGEATLTLRASEDTLAYRFPAQLFLNTYAASPAFKRFFSQRKPERFRTHLSRATIFATPPLDTPVEKLAAPVHLISDEVSVQQAAQMLLKSTPRVLAVYSHRQKDRIRLVDETVLLETLQKGISPATPLAQAIRRSPETRFDAKRPLGEVLTQMLKQQKSFVLVQLDMHQFGVVALDKLHRQQSTLTRLNEQISHARAFSHLKAAAESLPQLFVELVRTHVPPRQVGELMSALGEALTAKTVQLIEAALGSAPIPYGFLIAGSMARQEQTLKTDQDHALVLADHYDPALHGEYFSQFSQQVQHYLESFGYEKCPGNMMASNPRWRTPLHQWQKTFHRWREVPDGEAIMHASVFFDICNAWGDEALSAPLRQQIYHQTPQAGLFLHHLAENALKFRPPIGFFRHLIVERDGQRGEVLDLKKRGIAPIVELARVYALSGGLEALNTWQRLKQAAEAGIISQQGYEDLRDALDLISQIRQQHQARQIEQGEAPDNRISPKVFSHLEQRHLKDAFAVISEMQKSLALKFNL